MKVSTVADRCCGSGACNELSPEVFGLDDDGFVIVLQETPPATLEPATRNAATKCPTMTILVEE
jgi:ferredoxin